MKKIEEEYRIRFDNVLLRIAVSLTSHLQDYLSGEPHIDRVMARAKAVDSFVEKARRESADREPKYTEPFRQIQDQIGARIIAFYKSDVARLDQFVMKYFTPIEIKNHVPERDEEFSYFGRHFVLRLPTDVIAPDMDRSLVPDFFELQVKTLFQHAWSEAEHDLGFKPGAEPLTSDQKRRLAFTSAQAWGADHIFDELFRERSATAFSSAAPAIH